MWKLPGKRALLTAALLVLLLPSAGCKFLKKKTFDPNERLTQTMATTDGLAKMHYPASFAASHVTQYGVRAVRNFTPVLDEAAVIFAIRTPISDELTEFDRVAFGGEQDNLKKFKFEVTETTSALCLGRPGIVHHGKLSLAGSKFTSMHCSFMENGHGYVAVYTYPTSQPEQQVVLQRILDATEFTE